MVSLGDGGLTIAISKMRFLSSSSSPGGLADKKMGDTVSLWPSAGQLDRGTAIEAQPHRCAIYVRIPYKEYGLT
jgi:hypothetical protein